MLLGIAFCSVNYTGNRTLSRKTQRLLPEIRLGATLVFSVLLALCGSMAHAQVAFDSTSVNTTGSVVPAGEKLLASISYSVGAVADGDVVNAVELREGDLVLSQETFTVDVDAQGNPVNTPRTAPFLRVRTAIFPTSAINYRAICRSK